MNWCVYWQPNDSIECQFFRTEAEARAKIDELIAECEATWGDGFKSYWDITLMQVKAEVQEVAFGDGSLKLFNRQ